MLYNILIPVTYAIPITRIKFCSFIYIPIICNYSRWNKFDSELSEQHCKVSPTESNQPNSYSIKIFPIYPKQITLLFLIPLHHSTNISPISAVYITAQQEQRLVIRRK